MTEPTPDSNPRHSVRRWPGLAIIRGLRLRLWQTPLLLLAAFILNFCFTGIWVVQQNEQGVVMRFGRAVRTRPAGIHVTLPYPVETLRRVRTTEVRTLPIGESVQKLGPELDPTQSGREWLTSDTNIVELNAVIQYRVKNPIDYLFSVADLTDGRARDVILGKLVESALTVLVASMTVDEALSSGKASLQEASRLQAQQLANAMRLGLQIDSIHIIEVNPPPTVIAAFNDVSSAKADRERLVSEADAYAKDRLPKARAQANRTLQDAEIYRSETVNTAKGETQRFLDLAAEVRAAPEISRRRLWLETIESVLSEANVIVYPPPSDGLFTITQIE